MGNFPYVEIEGTPFEIGFQHGELFKDKILNSIQCYKEMFMDYSNLEWSVQEYGGGVSTRLGTGG